MQALRFWHQHNETALALIAALFLLTLLALVLRSIGAKPEGESADRAGSAVDVAAIETMLRAALEKGTGPAAPATTASAPSGMMPPAELIKENSEVRLQVESLKRELEQTQLELAARVAEADAKLVAGPAGATLVFPGAPSATESAGGQSVDNGATAQLQARIAELEERLSEYEIIEDDIADLSHFREENARLLAEVDKLKSGATARPSLIENSNEVALKFEPADSFELKADDAVMKEFAAAVNETPAANAAADASAELAAVAARIDSAAPPVAEDPQAAIDAMLKASEASAEPEPAQQADAADPLAAAVDTEKMLAEAAGLPDGESGESGLEQELDPDKLMAEASALESASAVDDVLGEFTDEKKGQAG